MTKFFLLIPALFFILPSWNLARADQVSEAIIQILPPTPPAIGPNLQTDNFIANEIASLSMGAVIKEAAKENDWANRKIDLQLIPDSLKITRIKGTDMAKITAASIQGITGKEMIDQFIKAYIRIRRDNAVHRAERAIRSLDNELIAQSDIVQDHRREMTVISQQYGIPFQGGNSNTLKNSSNIVEAKLTGLKIASRLAKGELETANEKGPKAQKLNEQIKILESQIKAMSQLAAKLNDEKIEASLKKNRYQQTKSNYENAVALLNKMKLQQQEARIALKMPRDFIIIRQRPN